MPVWEAKVERSLPHLQHTPQAMGKVGQVFHPNQDRIVSVREYARAQVQCWTLHALRQTLDKTFWDYLSHFSSNQET